MYRWRLTNEFALAAFVRFIVVFAIGRLVIWGRAGRGGRTLMVDNYPLGFTRDEITAIFAGFTPDESAASLAARRYADRGQNVPEDIRKAAERALTDAARR